MTYLCRDDFLEKQMEDLPNKTIKKPSVKQKTRNTMSGKSKYCILDISWLKRIKSLQITKRYLRGFVY